MKNLGFDLWTTLNSQLVLTLISGGLVAIVVYLIDLGSRHRAESDHISALFENAEGDLRHNIFLAEGMREKTEEWATQNKVRYALYRLRGLDDLLYASIKGKDVSFNSFLRGVVVATENDNSLIASHSQNDIVLKDVPNLIAHHQEALERIEGIRKKLERPHFYSRLLMFVKECLGIAADRESRK